MKILAFAERDEVAGISHDIRSFFIKSSHLMVMIGSIKCKSLIDFEK